MTPKKKIIAPKRGEPITAAFLKELADSVNRLESLFGGTGLNGMVSSDFIALSAFGGGDGESNVYLGTTQADCFRNQWSPVRLWRLSDKASVDPVGHPGWNPNAQIALVDTVDSYCFAWTLANGWKIPSGARVSMVKVGTGQNGEGLYAVFDHDKCPRYARA